MKVQTYIVSLQDAQGFQKDFYRYSLKKWENVLNDVKKGVKSNSIFRTLWNADGVKTLVIYATPDGYNKENIVFSCDIHEIYKSEV